MGGDEKAGDLSSQNSQVKTQVLHEEYYKFSMHHYRLEIFFNLTKFNALSRAKIISAQLLLYILRHYALTLVSGSYLYV